MSLIKQINVYSGTGPQPLAELAPLLESLIPVKFAFCTTRDEKGAGELIIGDGLKVTTANGSHRSSLRVPQCDGGNQKPVEMTIRFADDADVPFPFSGRSIRIKTGAPVKALTVGGNEKVLAKNDQGPVWTVSEEQGIKHFKSSFAIPTLPVNGKLNDLLNGNAFIEMVFLIQWLRELCASEFHGPPLRASYIVDDPNLHWPTYGHVNYREMAERAERENYHVSFATVPMDAWFVHPRAAKLFIERANRISLSIHGNDHIKQELAQPYTERERLALLQQAINRIERLERKSGVRVCRVMVPPHGACSDEMLRAIANNGFEAASISHGSLRAHNENKSWTKTLGFRPSELINGCPVMPRWSLAVDTNTILLAAYLNQTIILRGHQNDFKGGIEILDRHAQFINSLGNVTWGTLTDLSRMNFRWRMDGNICLVRPMSPKIAFTLPRGADAVVMDNSLNEAWATWRLRGSTGSTIEVQSGELVSLPEEFQETVSMEAVRETAEEKKRFARRSATGAVVRRVLTEGRDRVVFWK